MSKTEHFGKGKAARRQRNSVKKKIGHWKIIAFYLLIYDIIAVNASYFLGLLLRFDFHYMSIQPQYLHAFLCFAPFYTVFCVVIFMLLRLYNSMWRFASIDELNRIFLANFATIIFQAVGITVFVIRMPISYYAVGAVLQIVLTTAVRFSYRYITLERAKREKRAKEYNAMIIGAGSAGQVIIRELKSSLKSDINPVCVIDDNPNKWNRFLSGVPIVGGRDMILDAAKKYDIDRIIFAIPTATVAQRRDILNICKETGCKLESLPGVWQLASGEVTINNIRPVTVEDLLGRDPIQVDLGEIFQHIKGQVVLVTGGGGSIGSELC